MSQAELIPAAACGPAQQCAVKSLVQLELPHDSATVTWQVIAVDRCMGLQSVLKTSTIDAIPSWGAVWSTDSVTLPSTDPTLLYTVTSEPVRVASSPISAGAAVGC